jgi:putative effector of murein hydrolase LrgA (UPF0299 family)
MRQRCQIEGAACLRRPGRIAGDSHAQAGVLLGYLSLLLVPAGVGVTQHARLIGHELLPLLWRLLS